MAASPLFGQDGVRGALADANAVGDWTAATNNGMVALADLDGDHRLDGAVLVHSATTGSNDYRINLHLSADRNSAVTFTSTELLLRVAAIDINGDGDLDVVVERPFNHERLFIWLNDGNGHFVSTEVKNYPPGSESGEGVERFDLDVPMFLSCESTQRSADHGLSATELLPAPRAPSVRAGSSEPTGVARYLAYSVRSRAPPRTVPL